MNYKSIEDLNLPILESYKDCVKLVQSDYYRYCGKKARLLKIWCYTLGHPLFAFSFRQRFSSCKGTPY